MTSENLKERLNLISTQWSLVRRAQHGSADATNSAQAQLLQRYSAAAHRYLCKVLNDPDAADEVFQEFALRLVRGDLGGANPTRGRFRNFVKGTLFHLISDYRKQRGKWPGPLPANSAGLMDIPEERESDRQFVESWCDELLARAWAALADSDAQNQQFFFAVLRFRADHPHLRSPQMAEQLAVQLGKPFTAAAVRQILHRARERFAEFLLHEVSHSLENPTTEQLHQELAELGLLDYCRPALKKAGEW